MSKLLSDETAVRLGLKLGEQDGETGDRRPAPRGARASLVRCTSATAVGTGVDAAGEFCYPAVEVRGYARDTTQTDGGVVYLTVWDGDGVPGVPGEGQTYAAIMSGEITLESGTGPRQRAFAPAGSLPAACERFSAAAGLVGDGVERKIGGGTGGGAWDGGGGTGIMLPAAGTYLVTADGSIGMRVTAGSSTSSLATLQLAIVEAVSGFHWRYISPLRAQRLPDGAGGWWGPTCLAGFSMHRLVLVTEPTVITVSHQTTLFGGATLDAASAIDVRIGYVRTAAQPADGGVP